MKLKLILILLISQPCYAKLCSESFTTKRKDYSKHLAEFDTKVHMDQVNGDFIIRNDRLDWLVILRHDSKIKQWSVIKIHAKRNARVLNNIYENILGLGFGRVNIFSYEHFVKDYSDNYAELFKEYNLGIKDRRSKIED